MKLSKTQKVIYDALAATPEKSFSVAEIVPLVWGDELPKRPEALCKQMMIQVIARSQILNPRIQRISTPGRGRKACYAAIEWRRR